MSSLIMGVIMKRAPYPVAWVTATVKIVGRSSRRQRGLFVRLIEVLHHTRRLEVMRVLGEDLPDASSRGGAADPTLNIQKPSDPGP